MTRTLVVAAGLVVALATATGCASGRTTWTHNAVADASASTASVAVAAAAAPVTNAETPAEAIGTLEFHAFDLGFTPQTVAVPMPGTYHVTFVNDGAIFHDITFDDGTVIGADPGQTGEGDVVIPEGGLGFICSVPGHGPAGMTGSVTVDGPAPSTAASAAPDDHGGPAPETAIVADPNAPPPVTHDATAPAALTGTVHDIDLIMTEQLMTVATGIPADGLDLRRHRSGSGHPGQGG